MAQGRGSETADSTSRLAGKSAGDRPSSSELDSNAWSRVISAATLEDEIKLLKLNVDKTVTTPSSFAGRGHKPARLDFSLLAMLFAIVDQFDVNLGDKLPLVNKLCMMSLFHGFLLKNLIRET